MADRKNKLLAAPVLAAALCLLAAFGAPAAPSSLVPEVYEQPNGKTFIGLTHGDEFFNYSTQLPVYPVVSGEGGKPAFSALDGGVLKNLGKPLNPQAVPENAAQLEQIPALMEAFAEETNREPVGMVNAGGAMWEVVMVDGNALAYAPNYIGNPVIMLNEDGFWAYALFKDGKLVPSEFLVGQSPPPANVLTAEKAREIQMVEAVRRFREMHPEAASGEKCPTCPVD